MTALRPLYEYIYDETIHPVEINYAYNQWDVFQPIQGLSILISCSSVLTEEQITRSLIE
jgi:hypothetical protein